MDVGRQDSATEVTDGVYLTQLVVGDGMSVQRGYLEPGASVPEHSHHHEQVGYVVQGALTLVVDGKERVIEEGESFALTSHEPHAAANETDAPTIAIDVFSPPRENPDWQS